MAEDEYGRYRPVLVQTNGKQTVAYMPYMGPSLRARRQKRGHACQRSCKILLKCCRALWSLTHHGRTAGAAPSPQLHWK